VLSALGLTVFVVPLIASRFGNSTFLPHLYCYLSNPILTWTHVSSDLLIGLSYVAISYTLLILVRRSQGGIPYHWLLLAFGLFIVACGATHFMEVVTVWWPFYWWAASIKIVTAAASVATAIALPLMCPQILSRLESAEASEERKVQLETMNAELQRLNDEMKQYDQLKNSLFAQEAARIGDWEWNIRTGANRWSEAVEVMHGLEPGSYDGRYESWWASVHPDDRELVGRAIKRANETGEYEVEYRTIRADGQTYWTAARGRVIFDSDQKPEKLIGICMDVTERKHNEAALLRAEKLATAGRLAATVAHEINNPLEAVMNLVFLAKSDSSDREHLLTMAERELSRVAAIARQTLGFYRDSGNAVEVSLADVLGDTLELYASKLESKAIVVDRDLQVIPTIVARRGDLYQIVANLLTNAIDASPQGGKIFIRTFVAGNDSLGMEFEDQGSGIAPEIAARLFEPFFTTKKDFGTGLGLWVSRRLAEHLGGIITLKDPGGSGTGACFRLVLTAACGQTANSATESASSAS
jgi:PAS domain S-box-containing protein